MDILRLRAERLRSHRLSAAAATIADAASHMMATQGQEFWGGLARQAREGAGDRVTEVADGLFAASGPAPRRRPSPDVVALPPFEEYFLSYADRTVPCAPEFLAAIGPTANGIVRPILVAGGEIIGVWSHSVAVGKHHLLPQHEVFDAAVDPASVDAALARYARFIRG